MTETAVRQGRPEDKTGHSFRFRNDTWTDVEKAVREKGGTARDHTDWVKEAIEARLGYVRCDLGHCGQPVPVEFGDLTGRPLGWWISQAVSAVTAQHRGGHHPVTIGNGTDAEVPAASARARKQPPAAPKFRESATP